MEKFSTRVLLRVFLPFAAGYFLSYLYRVVNAVISTDIVNDINIGPSALGLLTATYFISFASFQLPLGVLLDRFGPRKTESFLLLFAVAGAFIFASAQTLTGLIVGRALIGFGVSACLMAAFKAYTVWFPRERWPFINGLQMASGGLGALAATTPVEIMLGFTDWRGVFLLLSGLTLGVALLVFMIVPEKPLENKGNSLKEQLEGVREVFTSLKFWQIAPLTTASQAAFLSIQGLWAGPWLRDVGLFDRSESAVVLFWIAVAMIAGFVLLGKLAERLGRRGIPVEISAMLGMALFCTVQLLVIFCPPHLAKPVWIIFGFIGTSGIIAYAALTQAFPVHLSGRVTTAVNLLVFVIAFFMQWAIGAVIELWPLGPQGSYAIEGYRAGFAMVLVIEVVTLIWFFVAAKKIASSSSE